VPALGLLLACGGGDLFLPADGVPASIEVVGGEGQSGRVGAPLANPVVGRVRDAQGRPVADVRVAFAFTDAGSAGSVVPDTATTDAEGLAAFQVVMGLRVGRIGAELRVPGAASLVASLAFTAVSADANELRAVGGEEQSAPAGAVLPQPLVVQVTDAFGNPIGGVPISWSVEGGGGVSASATPTGADGLASVVRTLGGAAGEQRTLATSPGLAGSPVTFRHVANAGAATVLEAVSGGGQSAVVGTALADPLVVRARDGSGNPVSGLAVAWVVGDGGGSLTPQTSLTDQDGLASTRWTLGAAPGANSATAVVSGVGTVGFGATAVPGTPPGLSLETPPPATAVRGVGLSPEPVVQLREPDGSARRLAGVAVGVSVVEGGATLRGTAVRATDANGRVEFRELALLGVPGAYRLAFAATGYTGVTSSPIGLTRATTTISLRSDDPDPSPVAASVRIRFRVESGGGTPTGLVRVVSDDGASCSATVAQGECALSFVAAGARVLTLTYAGDAEFEGSSATASHQVVAPGPVATTTTITADEPDPSGVGQAVTVRFAVTAASGTPTGSVTVAASASEVCTAAVTVGACAVTLTQPGARTLTATYGGDAGFAGSSGTAAHAVQAPPAAPSPQTSSVEVKDATLELGRGTQVIVTVRDASGAELENVSVTLSATGTGNQVSPSSATTDKKGEARFDFSSTDAGARTLTAVADGVTLAQQPTVTVAPAATQTRIISDNPDPSAPGASVTVEFAVTSDAGAPAGDVTVSSSAGGSCTAAVAAGRCDLVPAGSGDLTASYAGGGNFAGSSVAESHAVAARSLALRTQPSDRATTGVPLGRQPEIELRTGLGDPLRQSGVTIGVSVTSSGATLIGPASAVTDGNGRARFDGLGLAGAPGSYALRFEADGFAGATSQSIELSQAATVTTIVSDEPDPSVVGQAVPVRFQVTSTAGTPDGTVSVSSSGGETCTGSVTQGSCSLTFTSAGPRTLTASFSGGGNFAPSAGTESHAVDAPDAPPDGTADAFTGDEDQALVVSPRGVLANDSDPDGDAIQALGDTPPAHGQLELAANGGFRYVPAADFSGDDGFTYRASDGSMTSGPVAVRLTVSPVNDPPSFTAGPNQSVAAGAGPQVVSGWASDISPGPADESGQQVSFEVNVLLGDAQFSAAPAVAPDGTLTFTPSGIPGTALVTVVARDDGGRSGAGNDTSSAKTFIIQVTSL
jgi:hypothetical protein